MEAVLKILILSAYDAMSHAHLNRGLMENIDGAEFTLLTLPPRYFSWRVRGNSLSFAYNCREELEKDFDLIFATSMTDLTSLRGFCPSLADIPAMVYFHENQFAYPDSKTAHSNAEAKIVSIYNALAADKAVFNTRYNMQTFLEGAEKFLKKMPDHVPKGLIEKISEKSTVLHVPINSDSVKNIHSGIPTILWNHRWEYDKAPDRFLSVLRLLRAKNFDFRLNVIGQVFRDVPESFEHIKNEFADHIVNFGYMKSRDDYLGVLSESSIAVSTSIHDFQGLAVMEAADAGCVPVLPERLAYPEIFDEKYLYKTSDSLKKEAENCAELIIKLAEEKAEAPDMKKCRWENLKNQYRKLLIK